MYCTIDNVDALSVRDLVGPPVRRRKVNENTLQENKRNPISVS